MVLARMAGGFELGEAGSRATGQDPARRRSGRAVRQSDGSEWIGRRVRRRRPEPEGRSPDDPDGPSGARRRDPAEPQDHSLPVAAVHGPRIAPAALAAAPSFTALAAASSFTTLAAAP